MQQLQDQSMGCSLIASKTRVEPLPMQTIPKLELLGALLLARLMVSVKKSLGDIVTACKCFTDSTIVLHWMKGTNKNWKPFVQKRVKEIRERVASEYWHHCRGEDNPADLPSRCVTLQEMMDSRVWFHGPAWIREEESDITELEASLPKVCLEELRVRNRDTPVLSVSNRKEGNF